MTDILLREQCETSGGCWHKHKPEAAVYFPNLGFKNPPHEPSIHLALKKLKVATVTMSL